MTKDKCSCILNSRTLIKNNALNCNVKFVIEGEEEIGSDHLEQFITDHKNKLKSDIIIISDTGIHSMDQPAITIGLRGLSYMEVILTGPNRDLHSGLYGGAVGNPINILSEMIASLHDEDKKVNIPGFYDKVVEISKAERQKMNINATPEKEFQNHSYKCFSGRKGYTTLERNPLG